MNETQALDRLPLVRHPVRRDRVCDLGMGDLLGAELKRITSKQMKPITEILDLKVTRLFVDEWAHDAKRYGPIKRTELTGQQHTWLDQFKEAVHGIRLRGNAWMLSDANGEPIEPESMFGRIEFPIIR